MNPLARAIMACAQASGPPPFAYSDIPDQLLRINSLEGSLAFSGAVLTGVTDVSGAGETVTVTGSPVYTASNANLNGAPSFNVSAKTVVAPNVDRAAIRFFAVVFHRITTQSHFVVDGDDGTNAFLLNVNGASTAITTQSTTLTAAGEPTVGRKRVLLANDNATNCLWNGVSMGTQPVGSASGSGLVFGCSNTGGSARPQIAFAMLCSSAPSAPLLAALETQLITDFG